MKQKNHEKQPIHKISNIPVPLGHKELERISGSIKYETSPFRTSSLYRLVATFPEV
jgi:hypothetical protein